MKNKLSSVLLSVVIAFALWLYVITTVSPGSQQTYSNIPVVVEGESVLEEKGLMITNVSASTVSLELSGNRTDLAKVDTRNITVKADVSRIYDPGVHSVTYTQTFPGNVANNAFVVESKTPGKLIFTVERRQSKEVPVEVKWIGSAADGFMSDRENRVLDHPSVTISGPESVVTQIEKAVIDVDLTEQRESISQDFLYTLCNGNDEPVDAALITTNVEQIHLDVKIARVKDVRLTYALVDGGGAKASNVTVELNLATLRVSGSEQALDNLGDEIVIGTINLAEITKNTTLSFTINLPEGVRNLTGITDVEADVKLTGLSSKDFTIQQISMLNVPQGLEAELITESLVLTVRGPSAQVARLTADHIQVCVDFANAELGTSTFRANVIFADGFDDVGVLHTESISASLTTAEE